MDYGSSFLNKGEFSVHEISFISIPRQKIFVFLWLLIYLPIKGSAHRFSKLSGFYQISWFYA